MDPNAALAQIRRLVAQTEQASDEGKIGVVAAYGEQLAELVGGLDKWISSGGALPNLWKGGPRA